MTPTRQPAERRLSKRTVQRAKKWVREHEWDIRMHAIIQRLYCNNKAERLRIYEEIGLTR